MLKFGNGIFYKVLTNINLLGILGVSFRDVYVLLKDERQRVPAVHQIENEHLASSYGICVVS